MTTWRALLLIAVLVVPASYLLAADQTVVARVNGVDIKQSDLDFAAAEVGSQLGQYSPADRRRILLQFIIETELMAAAAEAENLASGGDFEERLKYHRRRALRDAYFDKSIRGRVSEETAKSIYDEKIGNAKPEPEVHAKHILVESKEEAEAVAARLKKGEDFAAVAKEKSKDPSGGDLGFIARGQAPVLKPLEDAAFDLEIDEISEPVQTQFGWHIVKIEEKRERPPPSFEEVKDILMAQLVQQKAAQVVKDLHDSAKVDVLDPEIKRSMQDAAVRGGIAPPDDDDANDPEDGH